MNLSGTSETYRAALAERREKEMDQVEQWIDTTQAQLYKSINEDGRRRSSFLMSEDCMDNINMIIKEYELRGFRKRRIQEEMEDVAAKNPFSGSKFGTLREKHNTFMNFIFAIELRQREKKQREMADRRTQTDRQLELSRRPSSYSAVHTAQLHRTSDATVISEISREIVVFQIIHL